MPDPPTTRVAPELLAPAGDWDCVRAAVENGADAVYFGLEKFNARMRARNFTEADLPALMEFLHRRGAKGYVTLNTLVFEDELADAERHLRTMIAAGVDAVIVQDAGICRMIRRLSPDFPIHASTQMTITSAAGMAFARDLGCNLVVLARECSIREIENIHNLMLPVSGKRDLPIEVFVHGALCVAYSGQCLTSEALGGRSANRGECAQACRLPYELISDGQPVPLGDRKYLLSPQDLAGLDVLPDLVRAGVASLKIEGRLKTPEYVANITRIYRQALDELPSAIGHLGASGDADANCANHVVRPSEAGNHQYEMEMAFSRGLYTGWLGGINNQALVHGRFGKKRGVYLGEVAGVQNDRVVARLESPLKPGDGVVFDAGRPEEKEEGGRVYEVRRITSEQPNRRVNAAASERKTSDSPGLAELHFGRGDVDFSRVLPGNRIWKTSDPELERRWRRSFAGDTPKFQRPVEFETHGAVGEPLTMIARDGLGHVARVESAMPLVRAEHQPLTEERLRDQFGRLGGTAFKLGELKNFLGADVLLPVSELNRLRRDAVAELERQRVQPKRWNLSDGRLPIADCRLEMERSADSKASAGSARLIVLVRTLPQLETALRCGIETVYCDFENPKRYRDAVQMNREPKTGGRPTLFVAPPRIFKPGEEWTLEQVRSSGADGYLLRNYDHLKFFANDRRVGDFSFNVANHLAAEHFKNCFGLERVTASYDLNVAQLEALLRAAPPDWFEVTVHQHMPMFHMEHCVFCAFLSTGTDYRNCGRPCDRHDVKLRDRVGAEHPVKADVGCRNTVFQSRAQTGAEYVSRLLALGLRHFRIEFVNETPPQVERTIEQYRRLLRGEITGAQLWRELRLLNQLGVTRGSLAG